MKFRCEDARPLVPSYLDGELEEDRAGPLRSHLLDCRSCREVAKDGKSLGRWFDAVRQTTPTVAVPQGFAARVAGLAFAGAGSEEPTIELVPEPRPFREESSERQGRPLLPFLLTLTSLAAAILFVLAIMIQRQAVPTGGALEAGEDVPWIESGDHSNATGSDVAPGEFERPQDPTAAHEDDAER